MNDYQHIGDEDLFAIVQSQSDERAFRALYRRYDKRVYAYCLRVTGCRESAEDLFQTVMMAVVGKKEQFKGGSFAKWLFTITRHSALKYNRKSKQRNAMLSLENYDEIASSENYFYSDREDFLLQKHIHNAMIHLDHTYREAVELRYFQGFSYEEISEIAAISISLAKVRVFRAKQQLQKILSPVLRELFQ